MLVFGVNDRDGEANRAWAAEQAFPFPVLLDPDRAIAIAYSISRAGDERYLINPEGGRRPAVIIDEGGRVLQLLPDLATVEQQVEALKSLP